MTEEEIIIYLERYSFEEILEMNNLTLPEILLELLERELIVLPL